MWLSAEAESQLCLGWRCGDYCVRATVPSGLSVCLRVGVSAERDTHTFWFASATLRYNELRLPRGGGVSCVSGTNVTPSASLMAPPRDLKKKKNHARGSLSDSPAEYEMLRDQFAMKTAKMMRREAEKNRRSDNWVLRGSFHPAQDKCGR